MLGFGVTLPVLPFFVERLALSGDGAEGVALHVGGLASSYATAQLVLAPFWGRFADAHGRRPAVLIGLAGFSLSQLMLGLGQGLPVLYLARVLGGSSSACLLPAASAYVADTTRSRDRSQAMGHMNASLSLGVVVGPALGSLLAREDLHFRSEWGHLALDGFSVPFLTAAALGILTLGLAYGWVVEPLGSGESVDAESAGQAGGSLVRRLFPLLAIVFASQLVLALFESTFALFADEHLEIGLREIGLVFVACGLVMAVVQGGMTGWFTRRIREQTLVVVGLVVAGAGILSLGSLSGLGQIVVAVGVFALGLALVAPSLLALVSSQAEGREGAALGVQSAAASLGQVIGPVLGGWLVVSRPAILYPAGSVVLLLVALMTTLRARRSRVRVGI